MYDELTQVDIKKMEEEIVYRESVLGPELGAELKRTRELGDLSENAEYKEAKSAKRRNDGRIRYLQNMIRTAKIIEVEKKDDEVGLFDHVTVYNESIGTEKTVQIVTTLRNDPMHGYVSKEAPLGAAIMGKKVGDRCEVVAANGRTFFVEIRKIEKGIDNEDLPISGY